MSTRPARNTTTWWREADTRHHLHPFTDTKSLTQSGGSRIITKADGVWLEDSEGNRILDAMAGLWCVNLGYGRKELADAAYRQMMELPYYNTFFMTATPPSVELAEKLAALTPEGLNHVFYGSSGSEANDTMVRLVRHYWNLMGPMVNAPASPPWIPVSTASYPRIMTALVMSYLRKQVSRSTG